MKQHHSVCETCHHHEHFKGWTGAVRWKNFYCRLWYNHPEDEWISLKLVPRECPRIVEQVVLGQVSLLQSLLKTGENQEEQ